MITIFNRRELIVTYDMKIQADTRTILADNKIDYYVRVRNNTYGSPLGYGLHTIIDSFGVRSHYNYEYKIYVKKTDYEYSAYLVYKKK
ncbi:MAG: hypothetical protein PHE51_05435 [Eubacteriales bacterium]|nr:hypothetical protein [Eubacteriales bacterium]